MLQYLTLLGVLLATALVLRIVTVIFITPLSHVYFFRSQGIPGRPFVPLFGQLRELKRALEAGDGLAHFCGRRDLGDVFYFFFGPFHRLILSDPDLIQQVMTSKARCYEKPARVRELLGPLLGQGLLLSEGDKWKRQRGFLKPAFHHGQLKAMLEVMTAVTEHTLDAWEVEDGGVIDVHEGMSAVALRIIGAAAFGLPVEQNATMCAEVYGTFSSLLQFQATNTRSVWRLLLSPAIYDLFPSEGKRLADQSLQKLNDTVYKLIQDRQEGKSKAATGVDLLDLMLNATSEEDGEKMSLSDLRDESMTFFLAGHETTANGLSWTMYLLAQFPQPDLDAEIRRVSGGRADWKPTFEELKDMPVLGAVVNESLRLFPPVYVVGKSATKPHMLGKYKIRAGTTVLISMVRMHRDPARWDRADEFLPERWLKGPAPHPYAFLPFSAGPRKCIGRGFAELEMKICVAMMVNRFRFELAPGEVVKPYPMITLRPKDGIKLRVWRREREQ